MSFFDIWDDAVDVLATKEFAGRHNDDTHVCVPGNDNTAYRSSKYQAYIIWDKQKQAYYPATYCPNCWERLEF